MPNTPVINLQARLISTELAFTSKSLHNRVEGLDLVIEKLRRIYNENQTTLTPEDQKIMLDVARIIGDAEGCLHQAGGFLEKLAGEIAHR